MRGKVCFFNGSSHGGAEHITVQFARILLAHGYDCSMFISKKLEKDSLKIKSYIPNNLRLNVQVTRYRWMIFHIYKYLKKENPNIVFCTMPDTSVLILLLKKLQLYRGKVIIRENNMPSRQQSRIQMLGKWLYPAADVLISQTEEMKNEMVEMYGVNPAKVITIYNPTDVATIQKQIKYEYPFDKSYTNYVSVGRVNPQKDYVTALKAFAEVIKTMPKSRFYIVGAIYKDKYYSLLHNEVVSLRIADKVFFEDFQDNPYKFQNGCDVYVLSSIYEGLPNAMLDAMYLGKPIAATECIPYIAQVVRNGENGYTVKVGDYKALADAMIKASHMKDLPKFIPVNDSIGQILKVFEV